MADEGKVSAIALELSGRAYLYHLLHVVFGSRPNADTVSKIYSESTARMLVYLKETLESEELCDVAAQEVGISGKDLLTCVNDAIASVEGVMSSIADDAAASEFTEKLLVDFDKLFQVPGSHYVHVWESPYIGKEVMLFQESTLDVRNWYHSEGFMLQTEKHFPDDHIAAMMEFLGRLSSQAYEAYADGNDEEALRILGVQKDFAEKHVLNWIDKFVIDVFAKDELGPYAAFAGLLIAFVMCDHEVVGQLRALIS